MDLEFIKKKMRAYSEEENSFNFISIRAHIYLHNLNKEHISLQSIYFLLKLPSDYVQLRH